MLVAHLWVARQALLRWEAPLLLLLLPPLLQATRLRMPAGTKASETKKFAWKTFPFNLHYIHPAWPPAVSFRSTPLINSMQSRNAKNRSHLLLLSDQRERHQLQRYEHLTSLSLLVWQDRSKQALRRLHLAPAQTRPRHQARAFHGSSSILGSLRKTETKTPLCIKLRGVFVYSSVSFRHTPPIWILSSCAFVLS